MSTPPTPIPGRWFNTPKGPAYCDLLVDRGSHETQEWVCIIHPTGQIWNYGNKDVRYAPNITLEFTAPENPWAP